MTQPLKYMTIRGSIMALVGDMAIGDEPTATDDLPDEKTLTGDVLFTFSTLATGELLSAPLHPDGPRSFAVRPIRAKIVEGVLTDLVGRPFVNLVAPDGFTDPVKGVYFVSFTNVRSGNESIIINGWAFEAEPGADKTLTDVRKAPNTTGAGVTRGAGIQSVAAVNGQFVITLDNGITLPAVGFPDYLALLSSATTARDTAIAARDAANSSKTAAGTSEANALAYRNTASSAATAAATSEANALAYRNTANTAATNAGTSATNAGNSASAANTSKIAAGTSETNAATSATNAASSASAALASKNAAGTSETNAAASATASQTARTGAETARAGAEAARDAATNGVVPDGGVTRPKLKTQDHTNLIFGSGFEGGIEAQDWVTNSFGSAATLDTTPANVWYGTRALKLTGNGEMVGPAIPAHPGEHFLFAAMTLIPTAIAGAGGMRIQYYNGNAWADAGSNDFISVATGSYTKQLLQVIVPADARAVRWRIAFQLTSWGSGIFMDEFDFRRGIEVLPSNIVGTAQLGSKVVTGAKVADGAIADAQIFSSAGIAQSKIATASGWIFDGLAGKAPTSHTHTLGQISDATAIGRAVASAADAAAVRSTIGAGTSSLAIGTTSTTAAAGNDSRLSDVRTPADSSVTDAKVASSAAIAISKLGTGRVQGFRNGTSTTTGVDILTEAQFQARVTAGTVDANTLYIRT